ncbi:MAG: DUF922 domain-containing protein [Alphaproteobacteria bacterium]
MVINKYIAALTIIVSVTLLSGQVGAKIYLNENIEYYIVSENDPQKLLNSTATTIQEQCEGSKRRNLVCSVYKTDITYDITKLGMGKCRLSKVKINDSVIYKKPKWKQKKNQPKETATEWNVILKNGMSHAKAHWSLRRRHLKMAYIKLSNLEKRCSKIERYANEIKDKAHSKIIRDNKRLDAKEDHFPSSFPNEDAKEENKKPNIRKN